MQYSLGPMIKRLMDDIKKWNKINATTDADESDIRDKQTDKTMAFSLVPKSHAFRNP